MMPRDYIVDITFDPVQDEVVRGTLYLSGSSGDFEQNGVLSAYFDSSEGRDRASSQLAALAGVRTASRDEEREDWLGRYRQSLHPLVVGERFVITPDRALVADPRGRIVLHIPQERAFGTGSHETTALCIEMIERLGPAGRAGIDVGTGSGILAIAMIALGARRVLAFDNDPEITGVVHRNLERNGIDREALIVFVGSPAVLRAPVADLITMNIVPEAIIPLLPQVARWLTDGGMLIVSGILTVRRGEVLAAARAAGLRLHAEAQRGEWWCGVLT
jgi:ribosomal protein L11 methyltransferase